MKCTNWLNFKFKVFIYIFLMISVATIYGQDVNNDSIIFSINDDVVHKSEFLKQYQKNKDSNVKGDSISLKDYAELYLKFKLKVKAAKDKGLDTLPKFVDEFRRYRKQLGDKYISNGKVTEEMVKDIYYRMTNEVNASHILLKFDEDAKPGDTLETYNTAIDLLKKIDAGEHFEKLALKYSQDPSVRLNKGNLGWFKAYKMVYPFETAAYNLEVGEVSQPVRTQFGYHIIKKNDERPSKGKIVVAHVMKNLRSKDSTYNAEQEINQIYQKIKNGEDFKDLAKQFSDHKPTASNGGELSPFGLGDLNSQKFTEVAFSLNENDSISKPFKTQFGWHIVKYLNHIPVEALEKIKPDIIKNIKTSDRSKRLIKNIKKDLLKKYDVSINYEALSLLEDRIDESILKYKWSYDKENTDNSEWILKIDNVEFELSEFLDYIQKQQRSLDSKSISGKINQAIDKFSYAKLIRIHNQNLEKVSPEFASEIKTYYEGLLLFEIMEQQIWKPVQNDSLGIKEYYEANRNEFMSPVKINGILASSTTMDEATEIKDEIDVLSIKLLKEHYPKAIFKKLNSTTIDDSALPRQIVLQDNFKKIYRNNGQYVCLYISNILPSENLSFDDVRGKIINIMQEEKEDLWIKELKSKYDIYVNKSLIGKLEDYLEN